MKINADFSRSAMVVLKDCGWTRSPQPGVERIMLDRIGDEVARATSVVRYAAGSSFNRHEHAMGEEFLVLEGVFSDEHADYPTGTYVRNPPGSGHSPYSKDGCRILVKLRQFDDQDLSHVVIDTQDAELWSKEGEGAKTLPLHDYATEQVQMLRLATNEHCNLSSNGSEVFVVSGSLRVDGADYPSESWLRFPTGEKKPVVAKGATLLWQKSGHLANIPD